MANNTSTQKLVNELEKAVDTSKKLLKAFEGTQEVTKDLAKDLETAFKGVDKKTSKGIAELNKLLEKTNKLTEESEKITKAKDETEKELIKTEKKLATARLSEIKEKQQLQKLDSLKQKTAVAVAKEEERLLALKEKQQKATKKTQDAYQKESSLLRKMKNELKATVIEMRRLGKSEDEVAKATEGLSKEVNKLDRELRDLDKSVSDSFREIGKYENALSELKETTEGVGTALGTLVGVVAGAVVSEFVDGIEVSRGFKKTLDDTKSSIAATAKVTGQYAMSKAEQIKADLEASAAIKETTEALRFQRMEGEIKYFDPNYEEKKKKQKEEINRLIALKNEQQIVLDNYNKNKEEQKAFANLPSTTDIILDTEKALEELNKATLDNSINNDKLEKQLSILRGTQEKLRSISDDDTRSLNEAITAKKELVKVNKQVAETQQKITESDLDTETKRAVSTLVSKGFFSDEEGKSLTSEDVRAQFDNDEVAKIFTQGEADAFTTAYIANQDARTEAATTALETEEKLAKLFSDKLEKDLDILIDGADKIKSINEQIIADESVSNETRKELLQTTKKLIEDSFSNQIKTISDFANKRINLNSQISESEKKQLKDKVKVSDIESLIAIKDAKELNEKIRLLGLSEIFEGRTLEVFKEKIQANQDLNDSEKELNKTLQKTVDLKAEIALQEEALSNDEEINEAKRLNNDIEAAQRILDATKAGSNERLEAQRNLNILLLEEQEAYREIVKDADEKAEEENEKNEKKLDADAKSKIEARKKLLENSIQIFDSVLSKAREKQNEETDKELDVLDTRIDTVRTAIENGNQGASDSLAELEKQKIEAEQKKEEIRKKEIRDEMLIAGLQAFASNDGNVGKTLGDVSLLIAALNTLPSFFEGTEDTGTVQKPLDSNGGRTAILHDNERVLTAKQNAKLGGISNEDLADLGSMHNSGNLNGGTTIIEANNKELISEVREMTKAVRSIPIQSYNYDSKGKYHEQVIQSNNKKETIKVRVNNLFK